MSRLAPHLRTGLADIDAEHERLFSLLDRADRLCTRSAAATCDACACHKREACRYMALDVLDDLIGDAVEHFAHEELEYTDLLSPDGCERHRQAHLDLVRRLRATFAASQRGDDIPPTRIASACREWLERHLIEFDLPLHESGHHGLAGHTPPWARADSAAAVSHH